MRPTRWAYAALAVLVVGAVVATVYAVRGDRQPSPSGDRDYYRALAADGTIAPIRSDADLATRIAKDRALFDLARTAGVTGTATSLHQLLDRRDDVNRDLAADRAAGRVVYGAGHYDVGEFYSRTVAQLSTATLNALAGRDDPRLRVSAADVTAQVRLHPSSWAARATTYRVTSLSVPWTVDGRSGQQVVSGYGCAQLDRATTLGSARIATRTIPAAALTAGTLSPDTQAELTSAPVGSCLTPFTERDRWVRYRLDARTVDTATAARVYGPQIRQSLQQQRFTRLLDRTASHLLTAHD